MKIQDLAIVFIIIILPISLLLSEYTQFQISTLQTQALYDTKLTSATYDAIKAFQLNTTNSSHSDMGESKLGDLASSVNLFRTSIMSAFSLNGYTEEDLDNYIPALIYTLYDGFYIYSPYENINHRYEVEKDDNGDEKNDPYTGEPIYTEDLIPVDGNGDNLYGIKPYINYSCRYLSGDIDVVITYSLDNFVTVRGMIGGNYYNKSGYLIENITYTEEEGSNGKKYTIEYNGVEIKEEALKERIGDTEYEYVKYNGTKYYLSKDKDQIENRIIYMSNGTVQEQRHKDKKYTEGGLTFQDYYNLIKNNTMAKEYYKAAYEFTKWFEESGLANLKYENAIDEVIDKEGNISLDYVWSGDTRKIFNFGSPTNIENELSSFNQHRLAVIRHKIETNLAVAIANYNEFSGVSNVFQMPELKENEWDNITNNISLISFLQGLPIGGKLYNGYTIVTNSESKEVVLEEYIYILGNDGIYHRIGDKALENDGLAEVASGIYGGQQSAGRLNLDFERHIIYDNDGQAYYYYPLKEYDASYDSIVMQNNVTTYDDIYEYVNAQSNELKMAFYTALGRERFGMYKAENDENLFINMPYLPDGYRRVEGTNLNSGLVIEDGSGNQYVWIEVPKTKAVYETAGLYITEFTNEDYGKIEYDLRKYAEEYGNNDWKDEFDSATGLTEYKYYKLKQNMLKSIYINGGFYVGRYETGTTSERTATGNIEEYTAVIKKDAYPYNFVNVSEAQTIATDKLVAEGCTTSLIFGVQWDLIMKYLETKGVLVEELKEDSTSWGNYAYSKFNITGTNVKYSEDGVVWKNATNLRKAERSRVLLSTGAMGAFAKQNIYDLAGNVYEWTLEKSNESGKPSTSRGGWAMQDDGEADAKKAAYRARSKVTTKNRSSGFRVVLYKDE